MNVVRYINSAGDMVSNFTVSDFVINIIVIGAVIFAFIRVVKKNFGDYL